MKRAWSTILSLGVLLAVRTLPADAAPSLLENLGRGVVAVRSSATDVFVSWRLLGTDPVGTSFNLYRVTGGGTPALLATLAGSAATNYVDGTADFSQSNAYFVRPIVFGLEQAASAAFTLPAAAPIQQYLRVPLTPPPGGTTPTGEAYTYSPNDTSAGDLDGDGEYDLVVKWEPSNAKDNSQSGYTGNTILEGLKIDGTRLWRIDLGRNIRAGAHYTQLMVFDLDGDGRAEVACKTADGSIDGVGTVIGDPTADWRNPAGYILDGPEFLTVFSGTTGAALATVPYIVPRGTVADWGDGYGNRVDRFLAAIAYLDGQRPSLVMARGYYTRSVLAAWNWRNGQLTQVWTFDTGHSGTVGPWAGYRGMGNHNLSVGDLDGDGRDEIMYGACAIDDDGTGLFTTGWGHGDAIHMSRMDPERPGLLAFQPHESPSAYGPNALDVRDARTGQLVAGVQGTGDIGRGAAFDVDPRYRGYEFWGAGDTGGMYNVKTVAPNALLGPRAIAISSGKPSINFGVWWDGDPLRELLDNVTISKWDWLNSAATSVLAPSGVASNNGTKATPNLSADVLGDWREEVIWRETANNALRIYTTTVPTSLRLYTLMHDRQYRLAIAWQNTGYNQPPHPSFYLGDGMAPPPPPDIVTSLEVLLGPPAPVLTAISDDSGSSSTDFVTSDTTLVISGSAQPNTTVTLTRFGVGAIGQTPADGSGFWSLDYTATALPEGTATFSATATDSQGHTGAPSTPFSVTVDTTAPGPPAVNTVAQEATLVLEGAAEAASRVSITLVGTGEIGSAGADGSGRWRLAYSGPPLPPAVHSFQATATDLAGNVSAPSPMVAVNTAVAAPSILAIADDTGASSGDGVTSDNRLVISGVAGAGDDVSIALSGTLLGTTVADGAGAWAFDNAANVLADGSYFLRAVGSNAGGTGPSSPAFALTVDTVAPLVVSVNRENPTAPVSSADTITFRVTFSETITAVDASDFAPVFSGGLSGSISAVSASSGPAIDVTVALTGEGTVRLDVSAGDGLQDTAGHALASAYSSGQTYTRLLVGNGTWIEMTPGGLWSDHANWQSGVIGGGSGNTASFAALELVGDNTVVLDGSRAIGGLVFGDTDVTTGASWLLDDGGDGANALTLAVPSGVPTIAVNPMGAGALTTLNVSLAGSAGLGKLGTGTLVLGRPSPLTGVLNVNGGILRLAPTASLSNGSNAVNLAANTQLQVAGGAFATGGLVTAVTSAFVVDGGSASLANFRTNSDFSGTLRINAGTLNVGDVNIRRNSAGSPDFNSGFIVNGGVASAVTVGLGTANSNGALSVAGGSLTVSGRITVGNQATGGRGGALRVIGGRFTSSDAVDGLVLARTSGSNANNVASATFSGGVSNVEKITLGYDASVTAGSATVTLNGGALYLGSGGIVKNGTGAFVTNLNLASGVLGARADWGSSVPMNLPAANTIAIKAADEVDLPFSIALSGILSGAGGFTKTGGGSLRLTAASTFSGPVTVDGGVFECEGSLAAGGLLSVNPGGSLAGVGSIARGVVLNDGGTIVPGNAAPASALSAESLAWNGGGRIEIDLAAGRQLHLSGALAKAGFPGHSFALSATGPLAVGGLYTLVTYAATDFTPTDLGYTGLPDHRGVFNVGPGALQFLVTGAGPTAAYSHWVYRNGLPPEQAGAGDDPDRDGLANLLEFALGRPPLEAGNDGVLATTVEIDGVGYPAVRFRRPLDRGGVTIDVLASADLAFTSLSGTEQVSATPAGDGLEEALVRSLVPLAEQGRQFFRLEATLPLDAAPTTLRSSPVGVMTAAVPRGPSGLALPLIAEDLFAAGVEANTPARVAFAAPGANLGALLTSGLPYYLEVVTGALEGERFDLDVEATIASADASVTLDLGPGSFSTLPALADGALAGALCVLRPHATLAGLQALLAPGLSGSEHALLADGVRVLENGELAFYYLRQDGETWSRPGQIDDFRAKALPPDASLLLEAKSAGQTWLLAGRVRANAFRRNLVAGLQSFATGFPVDLSPAAVRAFVDPSAPLATRWTGHNNPLRADSVQVLFKPGRPVDFYYLRSDGTAWRQLVAPGDFSQAPILGATDLLLLRRNKPDPAYSIPRPF